MMANGARQQMTVDQELFYHLAAALAVGLLVGVERGWEGREAQDGQRIAGIRTYGLLGLLGGCSALITPSLGGLGVGMIFLGLAGLLTAVYFANLRSNHDVGMTSLIAALLVFVMGFMAGTGMTVTALAAAVVTTLLLQYKPLLHRWLQALEARELQAGTKLLLISAVVLPVLPNQGYGPWQVLNPYEMWWMVVLIATISFAGYFALKLGGARNGAVLTGLLSGLVSSTALTLHFSRLARSDERLAPLLATGILLACGTMLPRVLLVASLINTQLLPLLLLPVSVMASLIYVPALLYWLRARHYTTEPVVALHNPLDLSTAMQFGLLLTCILLLGKALQTWLGNTGVLLLATASGIADVDAITLSLSRLSLHDLHITTAVMGIVVASAVNNVVKAGMTWSIGKPALGWRVGLPLLASALAGVSIAYGLNTLP